MTWLPHIDPVWWRGAVRGAAATERPPDGTLWSADDYDERTGTMYGWDFWVNRDQRPAPWHYMVHYFPMAQPAPDTRCTWCGREYKRGREGWEDGFKVGGIVYVDALSEPLGMNRMREYQSPACPDCGADAELFGEPLDA